MTVKHSTKDKMFSSNSSSQSTGVYAKEEVEKLLEMVATHIELYRFLKIRVIWRGESGHSVALLTKKLFAIDTC